MPNCAAVWRRQRDECDSRRAGLAGDAVGGGLDSGDGLPGAGGGVKHESHIQKQSIHRPPGICGFRCAKQI